MHFIRRGGTYCRVADPAWQNPLDSSYALRSGGRWNSPGSFPVVYLNRDLRMARANVARKFRGLPYGPELLRSEEAPILIEASVPDSEYVDILTDGGCADVGLPVTYPKRPDGSEVNWTECQAIGQEAWTRGCQGIACRSAAPGADRTRGA